MITICFTGHRPNNRYLGGYNINSPRNLKIANLIRKRILNIIEQNSQESHFHIISDMALGIDTIGWRVAEAIKNTNKNLITIEYAVPFENQACKWNQSSQNDYNKMLLLSDKVTLVDILTEYKIKDYKEGIYYPVKMQKRNEYMIDSSDYIIAVWDGSKKGGTYNCIRYAMNQDVEIVRINPVEIL